MRAAARLGIVAVAMIAAACGDDGDAADIDAATGAETIDAGAGAGDIDAASSGDEDAGADDPDAGSGGDTAGPGQFCELRDDGGPTCEDGLECCDDNVCRAEGSCPGQGGFVPCECSDDCQGSLCCDAPSMTFCTKQSACESYGGTEITTCP